MRFEKKFIISRNLFNIISSFLHTNLFAISYPDRKITSIYYDDEDFGLFYESLEGISDRKKVRVRFYDDNFNDAVLENKIKIAETGYKKIYKLKNDLIAEKLVDFEYNSDQEKQINLSIPYLIDDLYMPVLLVNYKRSYFENNEGIRVTLDFDIRFSRLFKDQAPKLSPYYVPFDFGVIEIKYDNKNNYDPKIISLLSSEFNLIQTSCSKYTLGLKNFL